jgi:hypothetical protein
VLLFGVIETSNRQITHKTGPFVISWEFIDLLQNLRWQVKQVGYRVITELFRNRLVKLPNNRIMTVTIRKVIQSE